MDLIGQRVLAVVTAWHNGSNGFARIIGGRGMPSVYLRERNIVTLGFETLKKGSLIRCIVAPASPGYDTFECEQIEIFKEQAAFGHRADR